MSNAKTQIGDVDRMIELLVNINRALWWSKPIRAKSLAFELTFAQGRCLWAIARAEGCTLRDVSLCLGVSPSTASELVERLVRAGLVQREQSSEDRRRVELRLAPRGRKLDSRLKAEQYQHVSEFLDRLSATQRKRVLGSLEELNRVIQTVSENLNPEQNQKPKSARRPK